MYDNSKQAMKEIAPYLDDDRIDVKYVLSLHNLLIFNSDLMELQTYEFMFTQKRIERDY